MNRLQTKMQPGEGWMAPGAAAVAGERKHGDNETCTEHVSELLHEPSSGAGLALSRTVRGAHSGRL